MTTLRDVWIQIQAFLPGLFRRSFKTHASVRVSDVTQSLDFYRKLGFRPVTSSRGDEVILLRNHRGNELNLVSGVSNSNSAGQSVGSQAVFRVENLSQTIEQLRHIEADIIDDAMTRRLRLTDPDQNDIEFFQQLDRSSLADERIYHIATEAELSAGLSEHYYLPPDKDRFVRARARSAFLALACRRVAEETQASPLIVELDESKLSLEAQLLDDADFDADKPDDRSAYPLVHSPISREALTAVGTCQEKNGEFLWPDKFRTLIE